MSVTRLEVKLVEVDIPAYLVAAKAGIPPSRISEYRRGRKKIPPHHLITLSQVLRCNPEEITGTVENEEKFITVDTTATN